MMSIHTTSDKKVSIISLKVNKKCEKTANEKVKQKTFILILKISHQHITPSNLQTNRLLCVYYTVEKVFGESKRQKKRKSIKSCYVFFSSFI